MDMTLPRNAAGQLMSLDGEPLAVQLKRQQRLKTVRALLLIAPLAVFLLAVFILPIAGLLKRAVDNPEVVGTLPHTVVALQDWNGKVVPGETAFAALARDLERAHADKTVAQAAKRLNMEIAGSRSLLTRTARHMPLDPAAGPLKTQFVDIDERWNDPAIWHAIARNGSSYTPYYLLASLDMRVGDSGQVERMSADESAYLSIFGRTLWMGVVITSLCILLGYPIAYWLANLPTRKANLLMIVVLLPFWTSVLVRVAAWIVLLQSEGLVNSGLMALGLINEPLQLAFNRVGVYVAMVHILLPFVILPVYSVMKSIPPTYLRAAVSLGSHPIGAFWRVYFPQTLPGIAAGGLLAFIISIGYYITPALLGSPNDQMVSYYVAFYTNNTINWGMAAALGGLLLLATMALYAVYSKLVGANRLSLG